MPRDIMGVLMPMAVVVPMMVMVVSMIAVMMVMIMVVVIVLIMVMMIVVRLKLILQPAADIGDLGRRVVEAVDQNRGPSRLVAIGIQDLRARIEPP